MKITSRGRYAVTAILDVAIYSMQTGKPVALYDVASRQEISLSYLEQIFAKLRKHKLVRSSKGPGGGYLLGFPANRISIGMIIQGVEENIDARQCKGEMNCKSGESCITHYLWSEISEQIYDFLDKIMISDLIEHHLKKEKNTNKKYKKLKSDIIEIKLN